MRKSLEDFITPGKLYQFRKTDFVHNLHFDEMPGDLDGCVLSNNQVILILKLEVSTQSGQCRYKNYILTILKDNRACESFFSETSIFEGILFDTLHLIS